MTYKKISHEQYLKYQGTPEQIRKRSLRNQARRLYEKEHPNEDISGKDIDHRKSLDKGGHPLDPRNLRPEDEKTNRGWRRSKDRYSPKYG